MRSRQFVAGATVAAALVLAGCGGSGSGGATVASTAAPTADTPVPSDGSSSPVSVPAATGGTWLGYHSDAARTGAVPAVASLRPAAAAWMTDLGGAVRGQPLVFDGRIIAATENNRVVALDPATGSVLWSVSLGTPLTDVDQVAGCGNIDPLGITSTGVIDPRSGTVYVVGEVSDGGGEVHHQLTGLSTATGAVRISENVDPPLPDGEKSVHLLQRASLALANGRVYVSYGGNAGDCGSYHGWVVGVSETPPARRVSFQVAADGEGGAIWQSGGAPAIDSAGNLYVTTGNANPDPPQGGPDPKRYTESVVKLDPELRPLASYKDRVAGGDEDLSTGNPVLLPGGLLFTVGKTDIGFLLRQGDLSEVAAIPGVCGSDPDGGPAYDRVTNRLFVPCVGGGIQVIDLAARATGARLAGADSAPIVVGRGVWSVDHTAGMLTEFDAGTGKTLQRLTIGTDVASFTSPSVGAGRLLVATNHGVAAFS